MTDSEDDYYNNEAEDDYDDEANDDYDDEAVVYDYCEEEDNQSEDANKKNYTILSEDDIRQRQTEHIDSVSSVLSIPKESASVLLRHNCWNTSTVNDKWFSDEEKIRNSFGLLLNRPTIKYPDTIMIKCRICYDEKRADKFSSMDCGHIFCTECWKQYVHTSIKDGLECLSLRCPDPECRSVVPKDMIYRLVSDADKDKYARFLVCSYVQAYPKIKWCPAPGCEYAVEYDGLETGYDVICQCSNVFCWNCVEDDHRPLDCNTVAKWITKNKAEAENTTWILAYTKPCPKCKCSIEKNKGCMHMTCRPPCGYEFCWLCLGAWVDHRNYYECNRYQKAKEELTFNEEERRRENAKNSIVRYTHYYERWATNEKSRGKAITDMRNMETEIFETLSRNLSMPITEFKFILEAWEQIVECRRVLKWTYAYGYYLPEEDETKTQFFEYLQGEAEASLERLHHCAETELGVYLNADKPWDGFKDFKLRLIQLTVASRTFFKNLVNGLEDGLSEVNSQ